MHIFCDHEHGVYTVYFGYTLLIIYFDSKTDCFLFIKSKLNYSGVYDTYKYSLHQFMSFQ